MDSIRYHIDQYVENQAITKNAVARAMGISRSSLYDKMSGRSPWMLDEVINLAAFMGCSVQELLTAPQGVA